LYLANCFRSIDTNYVHFGEKGFPRKFRNFSFTRNSPVVVG
ncbi:hypothetical protein T11_168, partial [Trichinella zimbabwensis]